MDAHPEAELFPGGSIPNILTSFSRVSGNPNVKLLSCVGDDDRGKFYLHHLDCNLGEVQISKGKPTGLWVGIYDQKKVSKFMDYSGASIDVTVPVETLRTSGIKIFITDIDSCSVPQTRKQINKTLDIFDDKGRFVLSLDGANKAEDIKGITSSISRIPDIVFGTAAEFLKALNQNHMNKALESAFPFMRLLVATDGEKGALIRFNQEVFSVMVRYIPAKYLIDETGAGDAYMGTMLAVLLDTQYKDWDKNDLKNAANIAAHAASLVIQSTHSRLTSANARLVQTSYSMYNR